MKTTAAKGASPLKRPWFHVLLALAEEPRHGSAIVEAVLGQTDGKLRLWPAMLYGSLEQLSDRGWIEEVHEPPERPAGESQRKRFYRITPVGVRVLRAEATRMATLAEEALRRLARGKASG